MYRRSSSKAGYIDYMKEKSGGSYVKYYRFESKRQNQIAIFRHCGVAIFKPKRRRYILRFNISGFPQADTPELFPQ